MSFGWGAGDILAGIDLAKTVIDAIKSGPSEYREIHRELASLNIALRSVQEGIDDPESLLNRKGRPRKQELLDILANCRIVAVEVQELVDKHSSLNGHGRTPRRVWDAYRIGSSDLDTLRGRLTFYTSTIDMFLHSLEGPALARIEGMVRLLVAKMGISQAVPGSGAKSIASVASTATILSILDPDQEAEAWEFLRAELMAEGILPSHLKTYRVEIIGYVKTLIEGVETPLVSPVSDPIHDFDEGHLYAAHVWPNRDDKWIADGGAGLFEYRSVLVEYGVLSSQNDFGNVSNQDRQYLSYIDVKPVTPNTWHYLNAGFEFRLSVGDGFSIDYPYPNLSNPNRSIRLRQSPSWELSKTFQSTWKLYSFSNSPKNPPGTFRLAAIFTIPERNYIERTPVTIVLRYIIGMGPSSEPLSILYEHYAKLPEIISNRDDSFTKVLTQQDVEDAISGFYLD
jgi:hypothetical protein